MTASAERRVRVYGLEPDSDAPREVGHVDGVGSDFLIGSLAVAPDGRLAVLADGQRPEVVVLDLEQNRVVRTLPHGTAASAVAITHDGKRILTAGGEQTVKDGAPQITGTEIRVWDLMTGGRLAVMEGHTKPVASLAISPDDRHVLSASWDGTVRLWPLPRGGR